jgi:hypothetical protein
LQTRRWREMDSNLRSPVRARSISEPPVRHNLPASTRGTEGSNPSPSSRESATNRELRERTKGHYGPLSRAVVTEFEQRRLFRLYRSLAQRLPLISMERRGRHDWPP